MRKKYILDTSAMVYILESFPRRLMEEIWVQFEQQCSNGVSITNRETKKALERELIEPESLEWAIGHSEMFLPITQKESEKLGELVQEGTFDYYNNSLTFTRKLPESIPFILAMAIVQKRTLVIHKTCRDKDKIEQICRSNDVSYIAAEDYLMNIKQGL